MQLLALDDADYPIFVSQAIQKKDYVCCECRGKVRLRKGFHRQPHFYHLSSTHLCRSSGKGMTHLQVQLHLLNLLPEGECCLEYRMTDIERIADVAWIPQKIVFEIQCSSISSDEVRDRIADYRKAGWRIVWILHDNRYNRMRMSAAEYTLLPFPHYFTNITQKGEGTIYDQISLNARGVRTTTSKRFLVDLSCPKALSFSQELNIPPILQERAKRWGLWFQGDILDGLREGALSLFEGATISRKAWLQLTFYRFVIRPYHLLFQMFLKKVCR